MRERNQQPSEICRTARLGGVSAVFSVVVASVCVLLVAAPTTVSAQVQSRPERDRSDPGPRLERPEPRRGSPRERESSPRAEQQPDGKSLPRAPGHGRGPGKDEDTKDTAETAKDPLKKLGDTVPTTAQERDRILANLYALLATAETEETAGRVANAIERIWLFSGSDTVQLLMERAAKALKEKNSALAIKLLDAVVDLAPDYAEGWNRRAYVHYTDQAIERALGDLRRTLALEPNHFKALEGLGQIMKDLDRKPAALEVFRRLLEVHPYASGVKQAVEELAREIDGQGI